MNHAFTSPCARCNGETKPEDAYLVSMVGPTHMPIALVICEACRASFWEWMRSGKKPDPK